MEIFADKLCVSYSELVPAVMSVPMVKALLRRGQVERVSVGGNGREALFVVESLPEKYKNEVYRRMPDVEEQAQSKDFVESVVMDGEAVDFFEKFRLADGRFLSLEVQRKCANNCAIMNCFKRLIEVRGEMKLAEFWRRAAASLPRMADKFPHNLPSNARVLQRKFNDYIIYGYECMVSKKFENRNSNKIDSEEKEGLLAMLLAHHNNLDDAFVARAYNNVAAQRGWKEITARNVGEVRRKLDLVTSASRLGASNFRNERLMQVKRSRPTAPFLMWTIDGWDVELLYQDTKTDKNGHSVTTYHNRMTMVVVLDPCENYPIGYAIGTHETPELITAALRDAAKHSEELFGVMLRANQIQCDHYAIKAMTPIYNVMGAKLTPARVKNAKSKVVEPYFAYLNKNYCKLFNNWSGFGVTTDPKRQPNSEALNRMRHTFPDAEGLREQIMRIMEQERSVKVDKFRAMMAALPSERRLELSREQYLLNFGEDTGFKNAIEGAGLRPRILGVKREYDCFDVRFREYGNVRWSVKYDPDNLGEVLAVSEDGSLRFLLEAKHVQPMALADRKEGDFAALKRVEAFNEQLESRVVERLALHHAAAQEVIKELPQDNLLHRLLIVDSEGQHKLPKAKKRLQAAEIEEVELLQTPKGAAKMEKDDYTIF